MSRHLDAKLYPPYTAFPGLPAPVRLRPYPYLYTGFTGTDTRLVTFATGGLLSPVRCRSYPCLYVGLPGTDT